MKMPNPFLLLAILALPTLQAAEPVPAGNPGGNGAAETNPDLPHVLLLGDSISIGYTRPVRELLHGVANVSRPTRAGGRHPDNCGNTRMGIQHLDRWLGETRWDLIHFNWGLWDLCYRRPKATTPGNRDKVNGTLSVPLEEYRRNLEQLVARLESTGAILVWAATTRVPEGEPGRFVGDDEKYNAVAREVMQTHDIPVNDLHEQTRSFAGKFSTAPGDVHFTAEGYARIALQVAETIRTLLGTESRNRPQDHEAPPRE